MKNLKYLVFAVLSMFVVAANVDAAVCTDDTCEAQIGSVKYDTLANAILEAKDGEVVELLKSINTTEKIVIEKDGVIIIDGKGFKVTTTAQKAFEVYAKDDDDADDDKTLKITFKNIDIVNNFKSTSAQGARAIDTRTDYIELTLDGAKLSTPNEENSHDQPLTIGGSTVNPKVVKVSIKNSTITGGETSYAFITYLPVDLDIENSTITGWAALYFNKDRWNDPMTYSSEGSVANIVNSTLKGISNVADNADHSNNFATIALDVSDVTINVENSSIIATGKNGATQSAFVVNEDVTGPKAKVTIEGEKSEVIVTNKDAKNDSLLANDTLFDVIITGGKFNTDVKEYLAEGTKLDETTGKVLTEHNITIKADENGTVTADKKVAVDGEVVTLTVTAKEGYKVKSVTVNGKEVKDNKFTMPNEDAKVEVVFEEIPKAPANVETNPKTGDNVLLYGVLGLMAIAGLAYTFKQKRTN